MMMSLVLLLLLLLLLLPPSMWPSCSISDVNGVNFRDAVLFRVLAEGLNHLSTFAASLEEFSTSSKKMSRGNGAEKLGFPAAV